jgi:hypothetical protein
MASQNIPFYHCNGGEVSRLALMRVDLEKMRLAADTMVNWLPLTQGPMTLRPGSKYLGMTYGNKAAKLLEFVYSASDTALIELTDQNMRIWASDALVSRDSVTSTVQDYSSWTLTASTGATVTQAGGVLTIKDVTDGSISKAYGTINCTGNLNLKHGLRFTVNQGGNLLFKMGTTVGGDDIIQSTALPTGTYSFGFVPAVATIYVQFESRDARSYTIAQPTIESSGAVVIPTPWTAADLPKVKYDQSSDIIFIAADGYWPRMIQRRSGNSWAVVRYEPDDGPFPSAQGDKTYKFTPSVLRGDGTLTCNKDFFTSKLVGSTMRLFHQGATATKPLNVATTATESIRVSGVSNWLPVTYVVVNNVPVQQGGYFQSYDRRFSFSISGTWSGTVVLQRTFDPEGLADWVDVASYTSNTSTTYQDREDNTIIFYRLFMRSYTSGTAVCSLTYTGSGGSGICRIVSLEVSNPTTVANIQVLNDFSNTTQTDDWRLQEWNGSDGYPSSVALHEGRLWWSGGSKVWGSVSDNYASFDFEAKGDAAPISRTIGKGPIQTTNFLLSLSRLAIGTDYGVVTARSSSFDEPLTPTKFNLRFTNTQGTYNNVRAMQLDQRGIFVQRSNRRIYMMEFTNQSFDFKTIDLTRLNVDIGIPGFCDFSIQRQIDTRMFFVRNDGQIACLIFDADDEVYAWYRLTTGGNDKYENVAVLPGCLEDGVYTVVNRTVNGATARYVEKFARLDEAQDTTTPLLADSYVTYSGTSTATITGLSHLNGRTVCAWGGGKDLGTYVVSGGAITLSEAVTSAVVGLPYTAQFISAKLAYAAVGGTAVNKVKRVSGLGFVLDRTHYQGVRYGQYDTYSGTYTADNLPLVEEGVATDANTIWQRYDQQTFELNGEWSADSRIYLEAASPRPATVLGFTTEMRTNG